MILKKQLSTGRRRIKDYIFLKKFHRLKEDLIDNIENLSNEEIAFSVIKPYVGDTIPDEKLMQIVSETINFPIPLVQVNENIFSLGIISWTYTGI